MPVTQRYKDAIRPIHDSDKLIPGTAMGVVHQQGVVTVSNVHFSQQYRMNLPALLLVAGMGVAPLGVVAQPSAPRVAEHVVSAEVSGAYAALTDEHLRHLFHELMGRVDDAQRSRLLAVGMLAKVKLEEFEQRAQQARAPRRAIVLADVVDRDALEGVRIAELRVMEERSRYVDNLLAAWAAVLTPGQRARFLADIKAATR